MLLTLSTFFRSSLSLDPSADVTLAEEIDAPAALSRHREGALPRPAARSRSTFPTISRARALPALILQPLVENAIKYGVSATRETVVLSDRARRRLGDGRMQLEVTNSAAARPRRSKRRSGDATKAPALGLANVCQRLEARFGNAAQCRLRADRPAAVIEVSLTHAGGRADG